MTRALWILLLLIGASAEANFYTEFRTRFSTARVPLTYELHNSDWTCSTVAITNPQTVHTEFLFHFDVVPHNHRLLFVQGSKVPQWTPRWFAEYQGLRTSVPLKTNDFLSECPQDFRSCIRDGGGTTRNFAYLRFLAPNEVLVEWTSPDRTDLGELAVSQDSEHAGQTAIMYSQCTLEQ